jgi:hypothetical protein
MSEFIRYYKDSIVTLKKQLFGLSVFHLLYPLVFFSLNGVCYGTEIILWDRVKLEPEIALTQSYDDNIFNTDENKTSDWMTSLNPSIDTQFAFTPRSRIGLLYSGRFVSYQKTENFRKDHHYSNAYLQFESLKQSELEIGVWGEDSAKQPYSDDDRSKDYTIGAIYTDVKLNIFDLTQFYGNYQHSTRHFDNALDRRDDYDRDSIMIGLVYSRSSLFPLLLEYRYEIEKNDQSDPIDTEFIYHAAYTGFKWNQEHRLSGSLRGGYIWSEYNGTDAYDGWAADTDLTYEVSPFTQINASLYRSVRESTRSERDTLDYYIIAGGGLSIKYSRLKPINLKLYGSFENRDYRSVDQLADTRADDLSTTGITAQWRVRTWLSFFFGYRYRLNNSNDNALDYTDNRIFIGVVLFPRENNIRIRTAKSVAYIDSF